MPCARQLLNNWHRNGDKMSAFGFSSQVGCGLEEHVQLPSKQCSRNTVYWAINARVPRALDISWRGRIKILECAACRAERERWWICAKSSSADSNNFVVKVSMNGCSVDVGWPRTVTDDTGVTDRRRRVRSSTCVSVAFAVVS